MDTSIVLFTFEKLLSSLINTRKNRHAWLHSHGAQLFGHSNIDLIFPVLQKQIIQRTFINNAPDRRSFIALNSNIQKLLSLVSSLKMPSGLNNSTSYIIEYSKEVSQLYILTLTSIVAFMLAKGMIYFFTSDVFLIRFGILKDHFLLVFELTSRQDVTRTFHYTVLVGEPSRLKPNSTSPLEYCYGLLYGTNNVFSCN